MLGIVEHNEVDILFHCFYHAPKGTSQNHSIIIAQKIAQRKARYKLLQKNIARFFTIYSAPIPYTILWGEKKT